MSISNEYNLFEYRNELEFLGDFEELKQITKEVWEKRPKNDYFRVSSEKQSSQQFIKFNHDKQTIKSKNYIGVIQYGDKIINLFPKIFYQEGIENEINEDMKKKINLHVLWWLSYCQKFKFPIHLIDMSEVSGNILDMIIYAFAVYTRDMLSKSIYVQFEDVQEDTVFIKGRLNINEYISNNIATARWHKFNCTYDTCAIDNKFNRILKYVVRVLLSFTGEDVNKEVLYQILFFLDDVSDEKAVAEDCQRIRFNPMYEEYEIIKNYCYLFLRSSNTTQGQNNMKVFSLLIPMEYIFEDFIAGFIAKEIDGINVKAQSNGKYLDESKTFAIKPDLLLERKGELCIADTKYKIIFNTDTEDKKEGISQSDIYQMMAYAVRYGVEDVYLFYPNTINKTVCNPKKLEIIDNFAGNKNINITVLQLPVLMGECFKYLEAKNILKECIEEKLKKEEKEKA